MRSHVGSKLTILACALALVTGAVPALAAARPDSATASKATKLPKAPDLGGSLKVKPTTMQIVAEGSIGTTPLPTIIGGKETGNRSAPLHWKTWNKNKAVVDAFIYEGTKKGYPSTVTLTHPRSVDGDLVFTQLKADGGPTAKISHQTIPGGSALQWAPTGG